MIELNYQELENEIAHKLVTIHQITLATCADNRVYARTVCPINEGLTIYFGTGGKSEKARQMSGNPYVALAIDNIQIEGIAENAGHPAKRPDYSAKYAEKYPQFGALYPPESDDIVVIVRPSKVTLYKYLGKACEEVLDVDNRKAYRIDL